jgi:hypothetical protein
MDKKYKIYCDLDGVLTDFDGAYEKLTGKDIRGKHIENSPHFWDPINDAGYDFWATMDWMDDGKELWNYIKKYNPDILSAPSRQDESRVGKKHWVQRELPGFHLILRSAKHKKEFAAKNHILIDDKESNINDWKENGGIGILHKSAKDTVEKLKELGL